MSITKEIQLPNITFIRIDDIETLFYKILESHNSYIVQNLLIINMI
jgi:hypothetical protein